MKRAAVIGAGFAGLSAATCLAQAGFAVTVFEKNSLPGGRAHRLDAEGFRFDMGPSWYWMPDVFESYFNKFGKKASDYYALERLDPSYRIFYEKNDFIDVPAGVEPLGRLFDKLEPGSGKKLQAFLKECKLKYELGMHKLVYKPGLSVGELADTELIRGAFRLHVFRSVSSYIRSFFKSARIIKMLEFPVLFLGATADKTPALYSLMNYADMALGTWYPRGGMYEVVLGMVKLAEENGVKFKFNSPVQRLEVNASRIEGLLVNNNHVDCDYVVAGADYHHVEQQLIPEKFRVYSPAYWNKRILAPSSLLFYVGLNKRISNLRHHTLFFDEDFSRHAREIYEEPKWPTAPQFYVSCSSQTDRTVCPDGCENLVILIPVAVGLRDDEHTREKYFTMVIERMENILGEKLMNHIIFKRSYAHQDFITDYNSFKGNAYGLANILMQTANLKPSLASKKINNLFFAGQLTVPGPGVPPSIISGQVAANQIIKREKQRQGSLKYYQ